MWPFSKKKPLPVLPERAPEPEGEVEIKETWYERERREALEALQKKAETPGKKRQYVILTKTGQSHGVQSLMDIRSQWLLAEMYKEEKVTFTDEDGEESATYRTAFIEGIIVGDLVKEKEK